MKRNFDEKIRLMLTLFVCVLFVITAYSSVMGKQLKENEREVKEPEDTATEPIDPKPTQLFNFRILNRDWDYWTTPPDLFSMPEGNVGIGTTNPSAKLDVVGNIAINGMEIINDIGEWVGDSAGLQGPQGPPGPPGDSHWELSDNDTYYNDGNVGIGTADPLADLTVNGSFIRQVAVATGLGPSDGTDNGRILSRTLTFNKLYNDTAIRIVYCDNFRVLDTGSGSAARWEIRIDGNSPPGGAIYQDLYRYTSYSCNEHQFATIFGHATGVSAGNHEIQVWVGPSPGYPIPDAHTGWQNSRWTIEAQEVWIQ